MTAPLRQPANHSLSSALPPRAWAGPREREGGNNGGRSAAFTVCGNNGGDSSSSSSVFFSFSFIGKKKKIKEEKSWRAVARVDRLHTAKMENKSCVRSKS